MAGKPYLIATVPPHYERHGQRNRRDHVGLRLSGEVFNKRRAGFLADVAAVMDFGCEPMTRVRHPRGRRPKSIASSTLKYA